MVLLAIVFTPSTPLFYCRHFVYDFGGAASNPPPKTAHHYNVKKHSIAAADSDDYHRGLPSLEGNWNDGFVQKVPETPSLKRMLHHTERTPSSVQCRLNFSCEFMI